MYEEGRGGSDGRQQCLPDCPTPRRRAGRTALPSSPAPTLNGVRGILRSMREGEAREEASESSPPMGPRAYGDCVGRPAVGVSASPAM